MEALKQLVRQTPVYDVIWWFRAKKQAQKWTADDDQMLQFYSQFVKPGDVCFDVGANTGNRTKVFLKLAARVVAVEPQDKCARLIESVFGRDKRLTIVRKALGAAEGQAEMRVSNSSTVSSLSGDWIEAVQKSGRFADTSWDTKQPVQLTTLDGLIHEHGLPAFIKIDVEGFEDQVVKGLSQKVKTLSLEFTPEYLRATYNCIEHLRLLGDIRLNYSLGETMRLALDHWIEPQEMVDLLESLKDDRSIFGDVYVTFV
jgi:FkbM family methyltransferase